MSINNRDDANKYYQLINNLVDDYIDNWKIKPSNLKKYLRPGSDSFNRFLERNQLKDVKNSDVILKDVIDDRVSMEVDGVFTFESFKLVGSNDFKLQNLKQCLFKGIEKATIQMEKTIADYFDTNLGSITIENSEKHLFKIDDWENKDKIVLIYSNEELEVIKFNIIDFIYEEVSKQTVKLTESFEVELENLIDYDSSVSKIESALSSDSVVGIISDITNGEFVCDSGNYYIWTL